VVEVPKSTNLSGISFSEVVRIIFSGQGVFLEKKRRARKAIGWEK